MIETLTNIQWFAISVAALSIGMSKTGVQGIMLMIVPLMAMAFGAKEVKDLRYRSLVDGESKPNNLMAGRAANGSYDGDEKICFDDAVCVQLHHIRIEQPLNKLHNKDLYNLEFYYPNSVANSFVGLEDNEDYE